MTLRDDFEASIAATPEQPDHVAWKLRLMRIKYDVVTCFDKGRKVALQAKPIAVIHWAERAIALAKGLPVEKDPMRALVQEASTPALERELLRRMREGETPAVKEEAKRICKRIARAVAITKGARSNG